MIANPSPLGLPHPLNEELMYIDATAPAKPTILCGKGGEPACRVNVAPMLRVRLRQAVFVDLISESILDQVGMQPVDIGVRWSAGPSGVSLTQVGITVYV
jgi:hypothetical protein